MNENFIKELFDRFSSSPRYRRLWYAVFSLIQPITRYSPLAGNPKLWMFYARHLKPGRFWKAPNERTELLIESVGGSAMAAFTEYFHANNPHVRIAFSCEVPASVVYAAKRRIPIILLIRDVFGVVNSVVTRYPHTRVWHYMRAYYYFHKVAWKYRKDMVVSPLEQTRTNPNAVIEACNRKFGTSFKTGDNKLPSRAHSQDNVPYSIPYADHQTDHQGQA